MCDFVRVRVYVGVSVCEGVRVRVWLSVSVHCRYGAMQAAGGGGRDEDLLDHRGERVQEAEKSERVSKQPTN